MGCVGVNGINGWAGMRWCELPCWDGLEPMVGLGCVGMNGLTGLGCVRENKWLGWDALVRMALLGCVERNGWAARWNEWLRLDVFEWLERMAG